MSPVPLDLIAEVDRIDPDGPTRTVEIRGQSSIAGDARAGARRFGCCRRAPRPARRRSMRSARPTWSCSARFVVHQRDPAPAAARTRQRARHHRGAVAVVLNLVPQTGETEDFSPQDLLQVLLDHAPGLRIDTVVRRSGRRARSAIDCVGTSARISRASRSVDADGRRRRRSARPGAAGRRRSPRRSAGACPSAPTRRAVS